MVIIVITQIVLIKMGSYNYSSHFFSKSKAQRRSHLSMNIIRLGCAMFDLHKLWPCLQYC